MSSHPQHPAQSFPAEFQQATGLPPDQAEYARYRIAMRLDGLSHDEVSAVMGANFATAPADWRERFERYDAAVAGGGEANT